MRKALTLTVVLGCLGIAACSWFRKTPPPPFPVDLCLHATPRVQWHGEKAHALYVRVYPLAIVDAFAAADVADLLADPPPALSGGAGTPQSRMLYPNTTDTMTFDAQEGRPFTYLGIAAGYYKPQGATKHVVNANDLRTGTCYTVEFGAAAIEGGKPAAPKEDE